MSQLDDQGAPSLDDGGAPVAGFSFYRKAAKESKDRNPMGNPIWKDVWEARRAFVGKFYGRFHLNNKESTEAFMITEPHAILAHRMNVGWIKGKVKSFPNRELVPCRAWSLSEDGKWIRTGKECPLCLFTGREPRLVVLWAVLDKREEQDPDNNRTVQWNLKYMAAESDDVREAIFNACAMAARDAGIQPTTKFVKFFVSRSDNEKSSAFGSSWIFRKFFSEAEARQIPQVARALEKLPDWSITWPLFKAKTMVEVCKRHKEIFDQHNLPDHEGYSPEGAMKVLGPAGAASGATGGSQGSAPSLDDARPSLDDAGGSQGPSLDDSGPPPANRPTLDDLAGSEANPDNPPSLGGPQSQPQSKPQPQTTQNDEDDDWVPYNDEAL